MSCPLGLKLWSLPIGPLDVAHMAPEVLNAKGWGWPAYLWSLGVTLLELRTGKPLFSSLRCNTADLKDLAIQLSMSKLSCAKDYEVFLKRLPPSTCSAMVSIA